MTLTIRHVSWLFNWFSKVENKGKFDKREWDWRPENFHLSKCRLGFLGKIATNMKLPPDVWKAKWLIIKYFLRLRIGCKVLLEWALPGI